MEGKEIHYVTKSDRTLQQLSTRIQGQKRMIVKYINGVKYIQIFDNEKGAKYPGIVLKYDEYIETWSDFLLVEKGEHFFSNPLPATVFPKSTGTFMLKSLTYDNFEPVPTASRPTSQTASLPTSPIANRPPSPTTNRPPSPTTNRPPSECQLGEEKIEFEEEDMKALADLLEVIEENGLIISNPEPQTSDSLPSTSTEDCFLNAQLCAFPVAILPAGSTPTAILPADSTTIRVEEETYAPLTPKSPIPYQPAVEPITPGQERTES